jgi:PBP1b-binding outer membrane lipoprotein LpoB
MTKLSALLLAVIAALFFAGCSSSQRPEATKTVTVSASPSPSALPPTTTKPASQPGPHS